MRGVEARAAAIVTAVRMTTTDDNLVPHLLADLDTTQLRALVTYLAHHTDVFSVLAGAPDTTEADTVLTVVVLAARRFGTTREAVLSTTRDRGAVEARQVTAYALRLARDMSYPSLGRYLGRDHTSVMHGVAKVGETPRLRRIANELATQIGWNREEGVA